MLDHLEHNPLEEPVEPSPFVPSRRTTQHLLPHLIDRGRAMPSEVSTALRINVLRAYNHHYDKCPSMEYCGAAGEEFILYRHQERC